MQHDFFNCRFEGPGELRLFVSGMLSRESNAQLQKKIKRLAQELLYFHQEDQSLPLAERHGTSMVLAIRPWELKLFEQYRRPETIKHF